MNAVYKSSVARHGIVLAATLVEVMVWALLHLLRLVVLAVLVICEPIFRVVLPLLSLAALFTAGLYYFGGSPGLKVSYGTLLGFSLGCVVVLALYEGLVGLLKR
jgi:hypothetical protein